MVSRIEMAPQLEKHWMQQQTLQVQQQLSRTPETDRQTERQKYVLLYVQTDMISSLFILQ